MTSSERAVRKASGERLLRDMARAARLIESYRSGEVAGLNEHGEMMTPVQTTLYVAYLETSRTRYACLMTAFGQ